MAHLILPIPGPQWCRMPSRWHCSASEKRCLLCRALTSLSHTPSFAHNFVTHTHIHTYRHTYIHACMHAYIRTCILSFHIPSCFVTHHLSHSTLSHTTVLTSRSFTTSFVFLPSPSLLHDAHYWKKLTCGVIRSFNSLFPLSTDELHPESKILDPPCERKSEFDGVRTTSIVRHESWCLMVLMHCGAKKLRHALDHPAPSCAILRHPAPSCVVPCLGGFGHRWRGACRPAPVWGEGF